MYDAAVLITHVCLLRSLALVFLQAVVSMLSAFLWFKAGLLTLCCLIDHIFSVLHM